MTLEERMAKELEGKFFWAVNNVNNGSLEERKIRQAQMKFRTDLTPVAKPKPELPKEPVSEPKATLSWNASDDEVIYYLRIAICCTYGVSERDLGRHSNGLTVCAAKHHFYWALCEYLPHLSVSEIARRIGKNHSSILHTKRKFDKTRKDLQPLIMKIDKMMEFRKCG